MNLQLFESSCARGKILVGHYTTWRQTVLSREGGYSTMQHFWLSPLWVSLLKCSRRLSFQRRHAETRIHGGTITTGPCGPYRQLSSLPGIKRDNYPYVLQPGHGYGRQSPSNTLAKRQGSLPEENSRECNPRLRPRPPINRAQGACRQDARSRQACPNRNCDR